MKVDHLGIAVKSIEQALEVWRDALGLERLLMDAVWTRLGRIGERSVFGFEPVIAFVFRLDILQRWLSYDAEAGKARFQDLVGEVTREHQELFA